MIPRLRHHLPAILFAGLALASGARAQQPHAAAQAPAIVTGRVTTQAGTPEPRVLIRIEAAGVGATTASDGMYRLIVPAARIPSGGQATLAASGVGLEPDSRLVTLVPGTTVTQDFSLAVDMRPLPAIGPLVHPGGTTPEPLTSAAAPVPSAAAGTP